MSGKAYTMREMKGIIEYLTEHRAYGEVKGRKMWMDYANSKLTTRTWQSLKETFLKRILPDITNPYYKLTVEQIASFRHGTDLEANIDNKLEIQTLDESSSDTHDKEPLPSNPDNTEGANNTGENMPCSKTNNIRSSTETVVIGPCYNTAEEIQKELESPTKEIENENDNPSSIPCSTKSIRDYITYSEPLTPMLQEVLHDFASEDEGDEPQMQIVEYPEPRKRNDNPSPIEILDTEHNDDGIENNEDIDNNTNIDQSKDKDSTETNVIENVLPESNVNDFVGQSDNIVCINDSENVTESINDKVEEVLDVAINSISKNDHEISMQLTKSQNNSNTMTDSLLPNNQEGFKKLLNTSENSSGNQDKNLSLNKSNESRKRSKSKEIDSSTSQKRICIDENIERNISEVDTAAKQKQNTSQSGSKKSKTKGHANTDNQKKSNLKSVHLNAHDVIPENRGNRQSANENDESVCISDDSLSKRQQAPQDVSIKTDEDGAAMTSKGKGSSKKYKANIKVISNKKSTNRNENPDTIKEVINEVVVLKSHTESSSDHVMVSPKKRKASLLGVHKMHRDKALANVFGFSSGVKSNRKKHMKNVKRQYLHQRNLNTSSSDEWTSDTETEFISPPRGRKNKQSKKYLKPKSARILSLEEEGGLFVMYGKKIYPVVKDGKMVKNYLTYTPDNDSEDDESYWKLKYVQEKKKTDELTKLLKHNKKQESVPPEPEIAPVPQAIPTHVCEKSSAVTEPPKEIVEKSVEQIAKEPEKKEEPAAPKTLKIQFMKDNETVQVEGHWAHIQPVLEQVVQILHKEPAPEPKQKRLTEQKNVEQEVTPRESVHQTAAKKQKVSGDSTPVSTVLLDEEVNEKLDKIEEEIYKKIQERDLAESNNAGDTNVTKRRAGRPRLMFSTAGKPGGVPESSKAKATVRPADDEGNDTSIVPRRQSRTPTKANDNEKTDEKGTIRRSSRNVVTGEDGSSIKYKFPSPQHTNKTRDSKTSSPKKTAAKHTSKRR